MAGRTGTILYTLQMPKAFIDRVMYIALGKWLGMGTVLCFMENVDNVDFGRGETTGTNYNEAFAALNLFSKHADKAISQQAEVLKELNVDEEDAWGKGINNILQQHYFKAYTGNERKVSTNARILAFQYLQSKITTCSY